MIRLHGWAVMLLATFIAAILRGAIFLACRGLVRAENVVTH